MTNGMASADSLRELSTDITGRIVENKVASGIPYTPVKESEISEAKEQLGYDDDNPPTQFDQINRAYYAGKNTGISEVRANSREGVFLRSQSSGRKAESLAARQELSSKSNPSDITRSNFERTLQSINSNPLASDLGGDLTSFSDLAAKKASLERLESAAGRVTGPGNPTISEALKNGGDGPLDLNIDQANRMLGMKSETLKLNRIEEADGIKTEVHKVLDDVEEVRLMLSAFLRPNVEVPSLEVGKKLNLFLSLTRKVGLNNESLINL